MTNGLTVCYVEDGRGIGGSLSGAVASFGGITMTQLDAGSVGGNKPAATYYALGIPSGQQILSVESDAPDLISECWFLDGANQTSPIEAHTYDSSTSASITTSVNTFIIGVLFEGSVSSSSPLSYQRGPNLYYGVDSNGMVPAGSFTNTWVSDLGGAFLVAVKAQ
jgi:hypothetical protein